MTLSHKRIKEFQDYIFHWWAKNRRSLPWRSTRDPYKIMVSEVMLQQTTVQRVIPKYSEFIEVYPNIKSLAEAETASVLRLWKGMGYNRRALYLKRASEAILRLHKGIFPASEEELLRLPGIGRYTARAILVFSFKKDVSVVDTNVRKIITHFFFHDKKQSEKSIQEVADQLLPKGGSWQWHQALMDFSAALPRNIKYQMSNVKKKTLPFRQSNRFYRGRIVDLLREKKWREKTLLTIMMTKYNKPASFVNERITSLLNDGLVVRKGSFLQLP